MSLDWLELETTAQRAYLDLVEKVRECRVHYENAGLPVPPRILRFLDDEAPAAPVPSVVIPPPTAPRRPVQARADWFWLPTGSAMPTTLVRAVLRDGPQPVRTLVARVTELRGSDVNAGVIANIGTRLAESNEITRDKGQWALANPDAAPILLEGNVWGSKDMFEPYDLAEHRRNCIVHVLKAHPDGLQIISINRLLERCDWVHAPLSKDVVKTDMGTLHDEGRAKRYGKSGKWRAT